PDKIPSGASLGAPDFTVRAPQAFSAPVFSGEESAPLSLHDNTVRQDDILSALPTLGLPETGDENQTSPETQVAQGVSQAGQLLSNGDTVDASIGYARSLGENLINQQITDWLNQYGKARVQLSTDKTGDADLLLPLIDKANSLVFSQVGIRANEDRNTTNLGLGYRQYQADWMWGVNSFYDYDITGGNSRVGVGSELWFDYLKFAGNGYFRLTNWHQSDLRAMRDYDERPANGFDLRAEG
ncbi:TPA: inverse autotransporter beta domain-containing protein, partial [Providencia alcalifaciens]